MKTNFDINIPSIPTRMIKFKIQDIKTTAFGSQRNRFHDNKTFLTKKFIESFQNFHQPAPKDSDAAETEAESRVSRGVRSEQEYRFLVPEERKYMLHHYDKYKNYEAPIQKETKYDRGYTFYRTDPSLPKPADTTVGERQEKTLSIIDNSLVDNFYFTSERQANTKPIVKHVMPTCVFKNETRNRVFSKLEKISAKMPGPGAYYNPQPVKPSKSVPRPTKQEDFDYKDLKKIITNIVVAEEEQPLEESAEAKEEVRNDHMFIEDDRDRFGNQKYPIAAPRNVPGPGSYEVKGSIEEKIHKIVVVEEQRKLLKEWFNN